MTQAQRQRIMRQRQLAQGRYRGAQPRPSQGQPERQVIQPTRQDPPSPGRIQEGSQFVSTAGKNDNILLPLLLIFLVMN